MSERYRIVGDDSGHDYYIPIDKIDEWYRLFDLPEDDPESPMYSGDVPNWARRIDATFTFADPKCE